MKTHYLEQLGDLKLDSTSVSIGNFDGLHLGHKSLIKTLLSESQKCESESLVITFDPHPVKFFHPQKEHKRLFPLTDLQEQLEERGVDHLVVQKFDQNYANLSREEFLENYLLRDLGLKSLVVGFNFGFGKGRKGNIEYLQEASEKFDFRLKCCEAIDFEDKNISSTEIKSHLLVGDVSWPRKVLQRPYSLNGKIIEGEGRGKTIGIPTANMSVEEGIVPKAGVYITELNVSGEKYPGITNIGYKPSFHDSNTELSVETHLMDQDINLYGSVVKLEFYDRIRDEKKFESVEGLIKQIKSDIDVAREFHCGKAKMG